MSSSQDTKRRRTEAGAVTTTGGSFEYMRGFGSHFSTEALEGALPEVGNTPMKCPYGLYAEQISGTAFTKVRHANQRSWWYRIRPSADHSRYQPCTQFASSVQECTNGTPEQIRWKPLPMPTTPTTFLEGLHCYCGAGDPATKAGSRIYVYACNKSMGDSSLANSDGDYLIVPEHGTLDIKTEFGRITVPSGHICVIQRGMRFTVDVPTTGARGYVCEVYDNHFELPPRGVIGANGLSNERDFETPVAWYEDRDVKWTCYQKYCDKMFTFNQNHSPYDVVAWHGNYAPYRYDLAKFCTINTVSYDHLDPSIFCVLTSQTGEPGVASCDFVIFPPRWMVGQNTFRPPYYHKNLMSEFMGNIRGVYEAKEEGFLPGGGSLHSCMAAHGPEVSVFDKASNGNNNAVPPNNDCLAFMFESTYMLKMTPSGMNENRDQKYTDMGAWNGFKKNFNPDQK